MRRIVVQNLAREHTLRVLEVVTPQRTDLVLTSDIPHGKANVFVFDSFNIEA